MTLVYCAGGLLYQWFVGIKISSDCQIFKFLLSLSEKVWRANFAVCYFHMSSHRVTHPVARAVAGKQLIDIGELYV